MVQNDPFLEQKPDNPDKNNEPLGNNPGRHSKLVPEHLVKFLELLRNNGNVSMSSRMIGWSRSTVYEFAAKNPDFRLAMKEAMIEGREMLLGEGWRQAMQWSEHEDAKGNLHVRAPDPGMLKLLIQGYFQQFKPSKESDPPELVDMVPESADLTQLSNNELDTLESLLAKIGGNAANAVTAGEG